jgi:hypothetical protein
MTKTDDETPDHKDKKLRKKAEKEPKEEKPKRTIIRVKTPHAWAGLIQQAREKHWRRLEVTIRMREWIMAGKPANLDAANAMLKARGLEDQIEAVAHIEDPELRAQAAERVKTDEGLCEFSRRPGKPGLWLPANNLKAGFKENWSVLGLMNEVRGSRKAIAEGVFVFCANSWEAPPEERDWIYLGEEGEQKIHTAVSHSVGPKGAVSAIKRHEYLEQVTIKYDLYIAQFSSVDEKLSDDDIAKALVHFCEHGLGACRSQGYGKHDLLQVRELEATMTTPASHAVPPAPEAA